MKNIKITKIIAFFLAVLMILPMVPVVDLTVFAEGESASAEYEKYIGYTATFADYYEEFTLAPSAAAVTGYDKLIWDTTVGYSLFDYIGDESCATSSGVLFGQSSSKLSRMRMVWTKFCGRDTEDGMLIRRIFNHG